MDSVAKLAIQDIRLHPLLQARCSVEVNKFCPRVRPGRAQVLVCLKANLAERSADWEKRKEKDSGPNSLGTATFSKAGGKQSGSTPPLLAAYERKAELPPASESGFSRSCARLVQRVRLGRQDTKAFITGALTGAAAGGAASSGGGEGWSAGTLQSLGLMNGEGEVSFLTLKGPVALIALLSLSFSCFACTYWSYRKYVTQGYTSYVPEGSVASQGGQE